MWLGPDTACFTPSTIPLGYCCSSCSVACLLHALEQAGAVNLGHHLVAAKVGGRAGSKAALCKSLGASRVASSSRAGSGNASSSGGSSSSRGRRKRRRGSSSSSRGRKRRRGSSSSSSSGGGRSEGSSSGIDGIRAGNSSGSDRSRAGHSKASSSSSSCGYGSSSSSCGYDSSSGGSSSSAKGLAFDSPHSALRVRPQGWKWQCKQQQQWQQQCDVQAPHPTPLSAYGRSLLAARWPRSRMRSSVCRLIWAYSCIRVRDDVARG